MPVRKTKDKVYRLLLNVLAPSARKSDISVLGKQPNYLSEYFRLLHEHHVLGSTLLLSGCGQQSTVCSSLSEPLHHADPDTLYRVASITKMAVSLAIGLLCQSGIIEIDTPIEHYLPREMHCEALEVITVRRLLSHMSGIFDPENLENLIIKKTALYKLLTDPSIFTRREKHTFRYSNLGFGILGCIIEYLTGQTINDAMRSMIFDPLEMCATMHPESSDIPNIMPISRVLPYNKGHDTVLTALSREPLKAPDPSTHYGYTAGGMYANASSIYRLLTCIRTSRGLNNINEWTKMMVLPSASYGASSPNMSYGFGMQLINDASISKSQLFGHQGFAYGCVNAAFYEVDTGNTLIFLNGGCSESRIGRIGRSNVDLMRWSFRKEFPSWLVQ